MKKDYSAGISMFFKVFAVLTFVAAIVLGFVLGRVPGYYRSKLYFPLMLAYWVSGLVSGMIMLAISKILDNQIEIKRKLGSTGINTTSAAGNKKPEQEPPHKPGTVFGTCDYCGSKAYVFPVKVERPGDSTTVSRYICDDCVNKNHG